MEKFTAIKMSNRMHDFDLKATLKEILENRGIEDLDIFLNRYKDEIRRIDLLNLPADKKNAVPVHFACKEDDDPSCVKLLVDNGADITKEDRGGRSLIHIASTRNCIKIVKYWIEKGVPIDHKNPVFGSTPLAIAVENGHFELTKYLLENGGDFLYEHNKFTIEQLADSNENDEVMELVKDYVTKEINWKKRRTLLKLFISKTPLAKLRMVLFRKVILYA
jgi:ankyrin repeat protein